MIRNNPSKITTTLMVTVTGEFYDDDASEETLRYCVEQDLEEAGFEVVVKAAYPVPPICIEENLLYLCGACKYAITKSTNYCPKCGSEVGWACTMKEKQAGKK